MPDNILNTPVSKNTTSVEKNQMLSQEVSNAPQEIPKGIPETVKSQKEEPITSASSQEKKQDEKLLPIEDRVVSEQTTTVESSVPVAASPEQLNELKKVDRSQALEEAKDHLEAESAL